MDDIQKLDLAVYSMMQTQMIFAEPEIKKVLLALSSGEEYRRVLKECASNFDFEKEYEKYIIIKKSLPKNNFVLIALIAGILYAIDSQKVNILDVLKSLYPNTDTTISYPQFTEEWLVPFVDAINNLSYGQPYEDFSENAPQSNEQLEKDIETVVNNIIRYIKISKTDQNDMLIMMCNSLVYSLKTCNNIITKSVFYGLINSLQLYKISCAEEIAEIETILKIYGVL